jgi:hypothetical protein
VPFRSTRDFKLAESEGSHAFVRAWRDLPARQNAGQSTRFCVKHKQIPLFNGREIPLRHHCCIQEIVQGIHLQNG